MKAIVLKDINILEDVILPVPVIKADEVLIRVTAIAINPVDSKTLRGKGQYERIKNDGPVILGWDVSGEVTETGAEAGQFKAGDEVFGMINFPGHGKTYAEFVAAPAQHLALKPSSISHEEAAATTLSALTAYQALQRADIKPGDRVFIQGAAGGVGYFAVQIAHHLGAYVIGTAKTEDKELLEKAGLNELIDYKTTAFEKATDHIDVVLDTLGGENAIKALSVLKSGGHLITLPSGAGEDWKPVAQEKGIHAEHYSVHSSGEDMKVLADWLAKGIIRPNIAHRFQWKDIIHIHELMLAGKISGKIIVSL
jgi:NADPH:quinone reductase-like Zn-dependent oxidoreductase